MGGNIGEVPARFRGADGVLPRGNGTVYPGAVYLGLSLESNLPVAVVEGYCYALHTVCPASKGVNHQTVAAAAPDNSTGEWE